MIRTRQYLLGVGDLLMCGAALALMIVLRFGPHYDARVVMAHITSFAGVFALWLVVFFVFNLYDVRSINPSPRTIGLLGVAMTAAVVLGGFAFYIWRGAGISPRTNLAITGAIAFVLIVLWRRLFHRYIGTLLPRTIVLVGSRPELLELEKELRAHPELGTVTERIPSVEAGAPLRGAPAAADLIILEARTPELMVAIERGSRASVRSLADAYQEFFARVPITLMDDELAARIAEKRESYGYRTARRALEIAVSSLVLLLSSPFVLIACIAKRLEDGGPAILTNHLRVGKDGKHFNAYKIRSMVMDADKSGMQWTREHDPRITPVGRVIRKLHIDEVPQFWNILRGDMALVGPRPEQPKFVTELEAQISYYYLRQTIKPGFTGWAQIKFRYARTVDESEKKWEYDLYYLLHRSFLLDVGIVLKTIQIIFTH